MKYICLFIFFLFILDTDSHAQSLVEALDTTINTRYNELNPVLHPDGRTIFFTRANHPGNMGGRKDKGDIWFSVMEGNQWSEAKNAGEPLNNANFNAIIGFSPDGTRMFLHNLYGKNSKASQGISVSGKGVNGWSDPEPVELKYYVNRSDHQSGSLSADGRVLLMSLESYGTYGAEDLYVSFLKSNGEWTNPQNLGSGINTTLQEMTPVLLPDNRGIIFSSNGHEGMGSMDLFYSERLDDSWMKWSKPKNLGSAINTKGRELYYSLSGNEYVYFVSTQNSEGYGDIKRIRLTKDDPAAQAKAPELVEELVEEVPATGPVQESSSASGFLEGRIVNVKTGDPVPARFSVTIEGDEEPLKSDEVDGNFRIALDPGEYRIKISAKGFMQLEEEVSVGTGDQHRDFELSPLDVGATFTLSNVLFQRGTTELLDESYRELDLVVEMMKENSEIGIELAGHTDNQGSARLNLKLSQERVDAVKRYLVEKGISGERITGTGYGGSRPVASNLNEETRKLNRRVEFTIVQN